MRSAIVTNWLDANPSLLMQETKCIDDNFPYKEFVLLGYAF